MRRQREQENYWDEYVDYSLDSSSDELDCDEFSLDLFTSDDEGDVVMKDDGKKEGTHESLEDNERKILLEDNKRILKPV